MAALWLPNHVNKKAMRKAAGHTRAKRLERT